MGSRLLGFVVGCGASDVALLSLRLICQVDTITMQFQQYRTVPLWPDRGSQKLLLNCYPGFSALRASFCLESANSTAWLWGSIWFEAQTTSSLLSLRPVRGNGTVSRNHFLPLQPQTSPGPLADRPPVRQLSTRLVEHPRGLQGRLPSGLPRRGLHSAGSEAYRARAPLCRGAEAEPGPLMLHVGGPHVHTRSVCPASAPRPGP